jgi:hypothetical protein
VVTAAVIYRAFQFQVEGFDASIKSYKTTSEYQTQLKLVESVSDTRANGRRDFNDMLASMSDTVVPRAPERTDKRGGKITPDDVVLPQTQYSLINFYSLSCRFTGTLGPIGPTPPCIFDANSAVLAALKMGCRTLVLEIDYYDSGTCQVPFPRLVIRDKDGGNLGDMNSDVVCQNPQQSNISDVAAAISQYAFSNSIANPVDPLIVVLYILRVPPNTGQGDYKDTLLTYYRHIARALQPLRSTMADTLSVGGNYSRQAQESALLLSNPITTYSGKTLIFCNADTSVFRKAKGVPIEEDLDFMINLRLTYNQNQFGMTLNTTTNSNGTKFALLESVEGYMTIPNENLAGLQASTSSTWTLCFANDPKTIVPKKTADQVMKTIGVNCIPIQIWSTGGEASYDYMFGDDLFKKYSFVPKPPALRYTIPATATPGAANPATNSNGGKLTAPSI